VSATVVQLRPPKAVTYSATFLEAWAALPETARLRSSRKEAYGEWRRTLSEISEEDLLARVQRYARDDKDHKRECGAPGFHRWLKWGRWEHWAPVDAAPLVEIAAKIFPDPSLRAAFHLRFQDDRARRWFDRCGFDPVERLITGAGPVRADWVSGPFKAWALLNDVRGLGYK
jgi:hypothetical protein